MTDFVCHTAPIENAIKIFKSGALQAPTKWRGVPASVLKEENRNAANDPEDYFYYVMFAWGNCQAGDRLVMERRRLEDCIPMNLQARVFYLENDCADIWSWSEKVYEFVKNRR